jgi:hypothetical protein
MASNPPNQSGSGGPKVTKQGKTGPIIGNRASQSGPTRPWSLSQGTSKGSKGGNKR